MLSPVRATFSRKLEDQLPVLQFGPDLKEQWKTIKKLYLCVACLEKHVETVVNPYSWSTGLRGLGLGRLEAKELDAWAEDETLDLQLLIFIDVLGYLLSNLSHRSYQKVY